MASSGSSGELTTRQQKAIAALLTAPDVKTAAQLAGVGARTLYRWIAEDPQFKQALTQAESETIDEAGRRLLAGQAQALQVLEDMMTTSASDANRRQAAATWLDYVLRWRELRTVEQRLAALESEVFSNGKKR